MFLHSFVHNSFVDVGKIEDLESTIREKETQLIHQEAEAREAISKWEQRCESIGAEIKSSQEERDEVERSFLKLEAEIELYHVSIEELNNTLETERSEKVALAEQREKAEDAYKNHIVELETAIQEHVEAIQQYESQLDERDEALVHAGAQIDALNKAIVDNAKESEDVVSKWQGKKITKLSLRVISLQLKHIGFTTTSCRKFETT